MGHHNAPTITVNDDDSVRLSPSLHTVRMVLLFIGMAGLGIGALASVFIENGSKHFFHSYLLNFCFFLSISLGALFFVSIQHLTRAAWSVVVRRIAEIIAQNVIPMALLFLVIAIPVLSLSTTLYSWNDWDTTDPLIQHKAPYLNSIFFTFRAVFYFACWIVVARFFMTKSLEQDKSGDRKLTLDMQSWSSWAVVAFALTVSFAAFDWLMSLDPHWFSTMFGVYFFAGCNLSFFAFLTVVVFLLQRTGKLENVVTQEHYHDLGKYIFGFTLFWGYIAFSQFLLYWYANIPEETKWYEIRQLNGWEYISLTLLFGHFFLPFFGTMSRSIRRNKYMLTGWAVFILFMHWVDMYYLVMPQFSPEGPVFGVFDVCCFLGIGGLFTSCLIWFALDRPLVPVKDPRLPESLALKQL